jgi:hypothetical protein
MPISILRDAFMLAGCIGVMATSQPVRAADPAPGSPLGKAPGKAKTCRVEGAQAQANVALPKTITVSSEGGWCTGKRAIGDHDIHQVARAPRHGQLARRVDGAWKVISRTPAAGDVGADGFLSRWPDRNVELAYTVNVIR